MMVDAHRLQWNIEQLGVTGNEGAALEFFIRHTGDTGGTKLVNRSITYQDAEGNLVSFPQPSVRVDCDVVVHPEKCPLPVDVTVGGCRIPLWWIWATRIWSRSGASYSST